MKKKICFALSSVVIFLGITSGALADNPPPIAACKNYLSYSDSQFDSWMSSNRRRAKTVASELSNCLRSNSCSVMGNIDNCAATLASRTFLSNFYANYSSNIFKPPNAFFGRGHGLGEIAKGRSTIPSSSASIKNTESAVSSQTTQAPAGNTHKATGSSINWY